MPKAALFNKDGECIGNRELNEKVFGVPLNVSVMHEVVVNYLANQRQGTQSTKTRSEVRGGGRKPWRQKGTGRARQGSIRSPQWKGGGVALGPKPRDYSYVLNKKVKRLALKCALSAKVADGELILLDKLDTYHKTKEIVKLLNNLGVSNNTLLVLPNNNPGVVRSVANISKVSVTFVGMINTYEILRYKSCVVLMEAVDKLEEVYGC